MSSMPGKSADYIGPITDTRVWDTFHLRGDDVILSTPPKCGTTWSQALIMMLLHGRAVADRPVWRDSLWLDCGVDDQIKLTERLGAQSHRRCIKSHTPFDGIPYDASVTYITVYRHPVDVHFSLEKHVANMISDRLDFLYPTESGAAFERFLTAPATQSGTDDLSLASYLHHFRSFRKWAHLPNVHFFHYADLSRDLPGQIANYARAMSLSPQQELVDEIAECSSFQMMKNVTRKMAKSESSGAFTDDAKFFDSATSYKWRGRLSQAEYHRYRQVLLSTATPDEIDWLENGTLGQVD